MMRDKSSIRRPSYIPLLLCMLIFLTIVLNCQNIKRIALRNFALVQFVRYMVPVYTDRSFQNFVAYVSQSVEEREALKDYRSFAELWIDETNNEEINRTLSDEKSSRILRKILNDRNDHHHHYTQRSQQNQYLRVNVPLEICLEFAQQNKITYEEWRKCVLTNTTFDRAIDGVTKSLKFRDLKSSNATTRDLIFDFERDVWWIVSSVPQTTKERENEKREN